MKDEICFTEPLPENIPRNHCSFNSANIYEGRVIS